MKSASDETLAGLETSSWWKKTWSERPDSSLSLSTASSPLFSSLAVNTTTIPSEARSLHMANPMPLFDPVTTAHLQRKNGVHGKWEKKYLAEQNEIGRN